MSQHRGIRERGDKSKRRRLWVSALAALLLPTGVLVSVVQNTSSTVPPTPPAVVNPSSYINTSTAAGPTSVTASSITQDTVWGPSGSPYIITGSLVLGQGVSLTLLPGTVVKLASQSSQLIVSGQLLSLGTLGEPVTFTSARDDSIGGDSNADGNATSPAPGDWDNVTFINTSNGAIDMPASMIDHTDFKFGGYRTGNDITPEGMVEYHGPKARLVIANSHFSESASSGIGSSNIAATGFLGIYNNVFETSRNGLVASNASGDVVGNHFKDTLTSRAMFLHVPTAMTLRYNILEKEITATGYGTETAANLDARDNSFLAGQGTFGGSYAQFNAWGPNWWGRNINNDVFPRCLSIAEIDSYRPPVNYTTSSSCPNAKPYLATGYTRKVAPALSSAPGNVPADIYKAYEPTFGPVNTYAGTVTYSVEDLVVLDAGKDLSATRTYSSSDDAPDHLGDGWSVSYTEAIATDGAESTMSTSSGVKVPFVTDAAAGNLASRGTGSKLTSSATGSSVSTPSKTSLNFDAAGKLSGLNLGDPGHVVDVNYIGDLLASVTGSSGRSIGYTWSGGNLASVNDNHGRAASFTYNSGGQVDSAIGVDGKTETYTYDDGRLTAVQDAEGVQTLGVGYDSYGRVAWVEQEGTGRATILYLLSSRFITQADGTVLTQQVDDHGRLVHETVSGHASRHVIYDADSRVIADISGIPTEPMTGYGPPAGATFYDSAGNPIRQIDPMGRGVITTCNANHDPVTVTDAAGGTTSYTYDSAQRVATVTDPRGGVWSFTHNSRGQILTVTDPIGRQRTYGYTPNGDLTATTDEFGEATLYATDPLGRVTTITDPVGRATQYAYTAWGEPSSVTNPAGGVQAVQFDDARNVVAMSDGSGNTTTYAYDTKGRLDTVTDPAGGVTTTTYDPVGRPLTVTDASGRAFTRTYNAGGSVTQVEAPDGTTNQTEYDPAGRAIRTIDELGRVTQSVINRVNETTKLQTPDSATRTYVYDRAGRVTSYTDAMGKVWASTYDISGNVTSSTDPLGKVTSYEYDVLSRPTKTTNPNGVATVTSYGTASNTVTVTDPLGTVSVTEFNDAGEVATERDANGNQTEYTYNALGQPAEIDTPAGQSAHSYNAVGLLTSQTDPRGFTTTATYDELGRVATKTYPDGSTEAFDYDASGNLINRTDRAGSSWTYTYDAHNRVLTETDPTSAVTTYAYDAAGQTTTVTDPTGVARTAAYDPMGRPAVITDAAGASAVITYDKEGRVLTSKDPAGVTTTNVYDAKGQLTRTSLPTLAATTYTYDATGNRLTETRASQKYTYGFDARNRVVSVLDPLNGTTTYALDGEGHQTSASTPNGHTTTWTRNAAGQVTSATDPLGNEANYTYDPAGNLTSSTMPEGGSYSYAFDSNGNPTSTTNPLGHTTDYDYDPLGRLTHVTKPSGAVIETDFDAVGRPTAVTAGGQTRTYAYDSAGRLTSASSDQGALSYTYDNRGDLASATDPFGTTTFGRDTAGRLNKVALPTGDVTNYTYNGYGSVATVRGPTNVNYSYDTYGNLTSVANSTGTTNAQQTLTYDLTNRLTGVTAGTGNQFTATYNADGQTTALTQSLAGVDNAGEGTSQYTYDSAGKLESASLTRDSTVVSNESYTWDGDGNKVAVNDATTNLTTTFDDAGRILSNSDGDVYSYDTDGNLTGIDRAAADDETFSYNEFGELVGTTVGSHQASYTVDALGRQTTIHDGNDLVSVGYLASSATPSIIGQADGSKSNLIRDPAGRLLSAKTGSNIQHAVNNLHGDISAFRNTTGTGLASTSLYDSWGAPTSTGTARVPLGFQSMLTDGPTGLVEMGARHYDSETGRFTGEDTVIGDLRAPVTLNRYTYANGNPLDHFDPDGHFGINLGKFASKALDAVKTVATTVKNVVGTVASAAVVAVKSAYSAVKRSVGAAVSAARREAQQLQQRASVAASDVSGGVKKAASSFAESMENIAASVDIDQVHLALDAAGFIPGLGEIADLANAALYLVEGDLKNAMISMAAVVPVAGSVATASRLASRTADAGLATKRTNTLSSPRTDVSPSGGNPGSASQPPSTDSVLQISTRSPRDVAVSPKAPDALSTNRPIGKSPTQNQALQDEIRRLEAQGAEDIRVNQQQVNYDGDRVGINRPDLQYSLDGNRHYVEYDTKSSKRGLIHEARLRMNDPLGVIDLRQVD